MFIGLSVVSILFTVGMYIMKFIWLIPMMFLIYSMYLIWFKKDYFDGLIYKLRKTWYFLLVIALGIHFITTGFNAKEWKDFIMYVSAFVFVDLAIFQTPTISKLWGAEFGSLQKIVENTKELQNEIHIGSARSELFIEMIERVDVDALRNVTWSTPREYFDSLELFLDSYCDSIDQVIEVYDASDTLLFVNKMKNKYNIDFTEEQLNGLRKIGNPVQLNESQLLYSFNEIYPIIIFVKAKKSAIHQVDIANLYSMSLLHTWFQK